MASLTNVSKEVTSANGQSMLLLQALASADRRVGATATKTQAQFRDYKAVTEAGRQQTVEKFDQLQAALVESESQKRQLVVTFEAEREAHAKEKAALEDRLKALEARAEAAEKIVQEKKDYVRPGTPLGQKYPKGNR